MFLNDVVFEAEQVVRLLESRVEGEEDEEYDLACGVDFGWSGEHFAVRFGCMLIVRPQACMVCTRGVSSHSS